MAPPKKSRKAILEHLQAVFNIKPVRVGELDRKVSPPLPPRPSAPAAPAAPIDDIEVTKEYRFVVDLLESGAPLIFVTGGAGTGKSTLIHYLRRRHFKEKRIRSAVLAPTGVAALNVGGQTIHSFFKLPPKIIQDDDVKVLHYQRELLRHLQVLIIDEISMVSPDVMEAIDKSLRLNRGIDSPFGGVQVVLVGDLFQLPPVITREERGPLRELGYRSNYFFSAPSIAECPLMPVHLDRVFRQADSEFVSLLENVRLGQNIAQTLEKINKRAVALASEEEGLEFTLTPTNRAADRRNKAQLARIQGGQRIYVGEIEGHFDANEARLPSPIDLTLKIGAQVMFTKNDPEKRWVNGTLGTVIGHEEAHIEVRVPSGEEFPVTRVAWEKYKYEYDREKEEIVAKVVGRYKQIPLMLAWAVTIHKAQGKTLERTFIDLGPGAFSPGQVYVAISRVRSIQDVRLARPIREHEVKCDPTVSLFYQELRGMTQLPD